MNYQQILNKALFQLKIRNLRSPKLASELLLAKTLNICREEILINLNRKINQSDIKKFTYYLNLRAHNKPIAHILNSKFFWRYKFYVNKPSISSDE